MRSQKRTLHVKDRVPTPKRGGHNIWMVIAASSVGTMIEWYDFYIFGTLATVISPLFYPKGNDTFAIIAYLSTFAVGFVVRPFGALFFGRIGDLAGRKYAFLVTLIIMETFISKMRKLKGVRKMILIEEAWKALTTPGMAAYILRQDVPN